MIMMESGRDMRYEIAIPLAILLSLIRMDSKANGDEYLE